MMRLLAILTFAVPAAAAEFTTLAGKTHSGTLIKIADGNMTVKTADGDVLLPMKELASVSFGGKATDAERYDELELVDGGTLKIASLKIVGREAVPVSLPGPGAPPKFRLPLESLTHWRRNAHDAKLNAAWADLLSKRGKRDQYVIRAGDRFDPVPGTILQGNEAGTDIEFQRETDNAKENYKLSRATGGLLLYHPPRGNITSTLCKLTDAFGNRLIVHSLALDGNTLTVTTVSDAVVTYTGFDGLTKIDFSSGNIVYLSDRRPDVTAPPPEKRDRKWTVVNDRSLVGPGFKFGENQYPRGIRVAPDVSAAYRLDGEFREFRAIAGIDDSILARTAPSRLVILADGKTLFNELVSHDNPPRELTLDVKGVKLLTIRVDGEGALAAGLTLADAKLQK
jgi:hypothetical protein